MMFVLSGDNLTGSAELPNYQIKAPPHQIISQSQLYSVHYWLFTGEKKSCNSASSYRVAPGEELPDILDI